MPKKMKITPFKSYLGLIKFSIEIFVLTSTKKTELRLHFFVSITTPDSIDQCYFFYLTTEARLDKESVY